MRHAASDAMRCQGGQLPSMKAGDRVTWNYRGNFYYTQPVEATVVCVGERTVLVRATVPDPWRGERQILRWINKERLKPRKAERKRREQTAVSAE